MMIHIDHMLAKIFYFSVRLSDIAEELQINFQDSAAVTMEGIQTLNLHLLLFVLFIVSLVGFLIFLVLKISTEEVCSRSAKYNHDNFVEIIWTILPASALLSLSPGSFSLLYSLDEISSQDCGFKISGHQWYWSYELSDYLSCLTDSRNLKYSSYLLTDESLKEDNSAGFFRKLEANKRIMLPTNTHLRLLVTAVDVLHSWTVPSFGIKVDACPGRLNQANLFIKRFGIFFGQCSEICGVNHGFMPILLLALPSKKYSYFVICNFK